MGGEIESEILRKNRFGYYNRILKCIKAFLIE